MGQSPSAMDMDMDMNIIRERSVLSSKNGLRESSISLSNFSQAYHEWMESMNKLLPDEDQAPIDRPILLFAFQHKSGDKGKQVSKTADNNFIGSTQLWQHWGSGP